MKKLITTISIFLSLVMCACGESDKERISRLVKEWDGKEIVFPEQSIFTILGRDTVAYKIPKSEYKVVLFVDSVGCTSCKLQLPKWKEFMN